MKKLLTLTLILAGMVVLTSTARAQEEDRVQGPAGVPTLGCCKCLGQQTTLDISTGQGSPVDLLWKVNNGNAYTITSMPSGFPWTSLAPAKWIQPVPGASPSSSPAAGVYHYTVNFFVAECAIKSEIKLDGKFSADNGATATLNPGNHPVGTCVGPTCFTTGQSFLPVNPNWLTPGNHTLRIDVTNNEAYSGLVVNAKLTRQCVKGP